MPALSGTINLAQNVVFSQTVFGATVQLPINFPSGTSNSVGLSSGSGAGQYQHCYANASLSVASGTPSVLNLTATLVQPDGTTGTFADVVFLAFYCPATNTDYMTVGGGTDPLAWLTTAIKVYPGQTVITAYPVASGLTVAITTGDRINVNSNSGTQVMQVVILGH